MLQADMDALAALATQKLSPLFPGIPPFDFPPGPIKQTDGTQNFAAWKAELNRLRGYVDFATFTAYAYGKLTLNDTLVSGPWPLSGFIANYYGLGFVNDQDFGVGPAKNIEFYFADTGGQVGVSFTGLFRIASQDPNAQQSGNGYGTALSMSVKITGNSTLKFKGALGVSLKDANSIGAVVTNFPGANFTVQNSMLTTGYFETDLDPGIYNFDCTSSDPFPDNAVRSIYSPQINYGVALPTKPPLVNILFGPITQAVPVKGIHSSKNLFKISVIDHEFGVFSWVNNVNGSNVGAWIQDFGNSRNGQFLPHYFATTSGLWFGMTKMVDNLNVPTPAKMPWNLTRRYVIPNDPTFTLYTYNPMLHQNTAGVIGGYDATIATESQQEPPGWKANTIYAAQAYIIDANGNFQFTAAGGKTGAAPPQWGQNIGAQTQELIGNPPLPTGVRWTLTKKPRPMNQATGRVNLVPRYPVYWTDETIGRLKPPTVAGAADPGIWGASTQWNRAPDAFLITAPGWQQDNLAKGWWIYRVSLNRYGTPGANGVIFPRAGSVQVTLGCMRNGQFVAFGSYNTGQTIDAMWPIFTSDALVYQCTERIDVQALCIATDGHGVTPFGNFGNLPFPIASAFYNDTQALLNLIN